MPYPGVPDSLTGKMESCVKEVMAKGHDKSSAIAICHTSIVKEEIARRQTERIVESLLEVRLCGKEAPNGGLCTRDAGHQGSCWKDD